MKTIEELGISPAPWTAVADGMGNFEIRCSGCESSADYEGENVIAEAVYDNDDARLIAAAPELYEALAAMLNCAEREAPFSIESRMTIAMDMARKAIAKAGGEE